METENEVTIATHNGSQVARQHNLRNPKVIAKEDHIDPNGHFEVWLDEDPKAAYERLFGEAVKAYNAKQKREDRQITDYYKQICEDSKKKPVYELIIGIYGKKADGTQNPYDCMPWYTDNEEFQKYWLRCMEEMIDRFEPDLLYSDGSLPFGSHWDRDQSHADDTDASYKYGLSAVARLYNTSIKKHGENKAVYLQKDRRPEVYNVGILDIEKSQLPGIMPSPWHTDTCIGNWFYDVHSPYKQPDQIIEMLVDIISKNGVMLLNILQRPDGTIDEYADFILEKIGAWFSVCGEAVYGTRPWRVFGEGETLVKIEGFREDKTHWLRSDFRFVQKNGAVYAFMMGAKGCDTVTIRSFTDDDVKSVELLGYGTVPFKKELGILVVQLPEKLPAEYANALKIQL